MKQLRIVWWYIADSEAHVYWQVRNRSRGLPWQYYLFYGVETTSISLEIDRAIVCLIFEVLSVKCWRMVWWVVGTSLWCTFKWRIWGDDKNALELGLLGNRIETFYFDLRRICCWLTLRCWEIGGQWFTGSSIQNAFNGNEWIERLGLGNIHLKKHWFAWVLLGFGLFVVCVQMREMKQCSKVTLARPLNELINR